MCTFLIGLQLKAAIVVALTLHSKLVMVFVALGLAEMLARVLVVIVVLKVATDLSSHRYPSSVGT